MVIKGGKPNQGYPVEVNAGQRVTWRNEGEEAVVITGDGSVVPFSSLDLTAGSKSTPITFTTPNLGHRDARGRDASPRGTPTGSAGRRSSSRSLSRSPAMRTRTRPGGGSST